MMAQRMLYPTNEPADQSGNASLSVIKIHPEFLEKPLEIDDAKVTDILALRLISARRIIRVPARITDDPLWKVLENPAKSKNKKAIHKKVEDLQEEFWSRAL